MLGQAKDFFDGVLPNSVDYLQRPDCIGGTFYIALRHERGRKILSIGDEEGNVVDIKVVETLKEVEDIADALR